MPGRLSRIRISKRSFASAGNIRRKSRSVSNGIKTENTRLSFIPFREESFDTEKKIARKVGTAAKGVSAWVPWENQRLVGSPEPPPPFHAVRAYPNIDPHGGKTPEHDPHGPVAVQREPGAERIIFMENYGNSTTWERKADAVAAMKKADLDDCEVVAVVDLQFARLTQAKWREIWEKPLK